MIPRFPVSLLLPAALLTLVPSYAQEPLNRPVPLTQGFQDGGASSERLSTLAAARRAQEFGVSTMAIMLYRQLLDDPAGSGGDRTQITLALTTALLNHGDIAEAEKVLAGVPATMRGSAWHLRAGLIAAYQKKIEGARGEFAAVKSAELPAADVGWWYFLQGMMANIMGDTAALKFYEQAESAAQSEMQRARFLLAEGEARIKLGTVTQGDIDAARKTAEPLLGKPLGYGLFREYTIMLDAFGQKSRAMEELAQQLRSLPPDERKEPDEIRLLMGLIAGAREGAGRNALGQLLTNGTDPEKQRAALQLLAEASLAGAARTEFRKKLDDLIAAPKQHPIYDDMLALRAQLALDAQDYAQAEKDAKELLEKFPGSLLKAQALGILTSAAWADHRYLTAVDYAQKARDALQLPEDRQTHAELGVLIAEAWFRAENFQLAADAYDAVLAEPPAGVVAGGLMFQRVLAEIKAAGTDGEKLRKVESLLDRLARDPGFDADNRWKAEWDLALAMLVAPDAAAAAYARVNKLLATDSPDGPVPAELRARMKWLRARLSLEAGQPEQALKFADSLMGELDGLDPKLRTEIASTTMLLKAKTYFVLARDAAAIDEVLTKLRTDYRDTDAAAHSYIDEADYYEKKDNIAEAERCLTKLVGEYPKSAYAPYALLRVAVLEEHRGQEANLREANYRIESLIKDYPQSEWIFAARFEQGDIFRQLSEFPSAQNVYEAIIRAFPQHPDVLKAKLALADTHAAQTGEGHADRAKEYYDQLWGLTAAPLDLRVEAGFKLGLNFVRRGDTKGAEKVWWVGVVNPFLIDPAVAAQLGPTGRYWMSCTLLYLEDLYRKQGLLDEARTVRTLKVKAGLPETNIVPEKPSLKPTPPTL